MGKNLAKTYDPHDFEERIYKDWETKGAFRAHIDENKKPFTIVMPPPNITGQLHMGHALDQTLQDVLIRYKRMKGYSALWVPGSDHASIATEVKVVERIRKEEGLEKEDLGREEFLKRVWAWKEEFGGKITEQCRKLGDSCDWERERFTMDEGCSRAVKEFFVKLYKKGLIYKGNRLINWCPVCGTSLSDAEVEHEDKNGKYWYFRYPGADGGEGIVIATSRPETMFADVAIAVHPDDERYKHLIGTEVIIPLTDRKIPIIVDEHPDPEKGTGAVKITPAADPNDFIVGERHGLDMPACMNLDATMNEMAGKYQGMDRYECRKAWVADLEAAGYLVKTEDIVIPVGTCYRCHSAVEPMLSDQWFVAMEELAKPAIEAAKSGELSHVPERFEKIYLHWLENIKDWCISRQLWWGHRIPAYYCDDCGHIEVSASDVAKCPKCGSTNVRQDEDVLDTWFSSALWPFSTLGWPEETPDLKYFYPTDVLVTGYDIIFFWVVRMVFSALAMTDKVPFKYVYVHGLVRDEQGRKMSKSLGNGIDPLEVIQETGADALRFMLISGITPGNDTRYIPKKLESARNFANKLWNASRFVIMNLQDENGNFLPMEKDQSKWQDEDKWIIAKVNEAAKYVEEAMDKFDLSLAAQRVYDLIWNEYCDWYIEIVKGRLYGDDEEDKKTARFVLVKALGDMLKMLHPFMPFITEEIWGYLPKEKDGFIMLEDFPTYDENMTFAEEKEELETAMEAIKAIRNIRAEAEAAPSKALSAVIIAEGEMLSRMQQCERYLKKLANIESVEVTSDKGKIPAEVMSAVIGGAEIHIPLAELVDFKVEFERLSKEKKRLEGEVLRGEKMLSNPGFVNKAPEKKIAEEKEKLANYRDMLEKVKERLAAVEKKNMMNAVEKIGQFNKFGSVLGLDRVRELLKRLDDPQKDLKIIHVAGTNGKGSVCRFIYEVLRKAGYKVGIYSSPYLEVFNERIEFDGKYIPDEYLDKYADKASKIAKEMCDEGMLSPTEFDVVTAIGFMYFAEMNADFVILEVGLGGIGDSTNVVENPEITIISSVSLDHTDRLGDTVEKIAAEKAGIIKEGITMVSGVEDFGAKNVIISKSVEKNAPFIDASKFHRKIKEESIYGSVFDCEVLGKTFTDMKISLAGAHQVANAVVALTAVEVLRRNGIIHITDEAVYSGMKEAKNKGRFEPIGKDPVYILDGAHNEAGMAGFVKTVKSDLPNKKLLIAVGILADKKLQEMMESLKTLDGDFIATEPQNPRMLSHDKMRKALEDSGKNVVFEGKPEEILEYVRENDKKYDTVLFVGSLYLIGEIRRLLDDR